MANSREVLTEVGSATNEAAERVYEAIAGEDAEDRSCEAIPEEACREIPGNFILNVGNGACTKLAAQLAAPFYALQAQSATGSGVGNLAVLVMASSFAAVISSPFWGRFSDTSSRRVMVAGGVWTAITVALALSSELLPEGTAGLAIFVLVFLSSGFAVAGVRPGRKTYLVDGAPAELRPLMVAVANTLVGVMYAVAAVFGVLADWLGVPSVLVLLGLMALVGTVMAWGLPEAEGLVRKEG